MDFVPSAAQGVNHTPKIHRSRGLLFLGVVRLIRSFMKDIADQGGGKRLNFEINKIEAECLWAIYFHLWRNESRGEKKKISGEPVNAAGSLLLRKDCRCSPVYPCTFVPLCESVCVCVCVCLLFYFFFRSPHQCARVGKGESRETWTRAQ